MYKLLQTINLLILGLFTLAHVTLARAEGATFDAAQLDSYDLELRQNEMATDGMGASSVDCLPLYLRCLQDTVQAMFICHDYGRYSVECGSARRNAALSCVAFALCEALSAPSE